FGLNTNSALTTDGFEADCYDTNGTNPILSSDYLELLGGYSLQQMNQIPASKICGLYDGTTAVFPGVYSSFPGPITLRFRSDGSLKAFGGAGPAINADQAQGIVASGGEKGFRLSYSLTPNCP
ncbi:hypothetical protein TCAL_16067, partial [Tigriopus californicus]